MGLQEHAGVFRRVADTPAKRAIRAWPPARAGRAPERAGSVRFAVAKFAVSGIVALVLVGAGAAIALHRLSTQEAIRDARVLSEAIAENVVGPALTDAALDGDPAAVAALDGLLRAWIRPPVVSIKLWTPEGRIAYATEPELIGASFPLEIEEVNVLRDWQPAAHETSLEGPAHAFLRNDKGLVEVYLPLYTRTGRAALLETYIADSSIAAGGHRVWIAFVPALLLGLLVLALVQVPLAWSMARRLWRGQQDRIVLLHRAIEASDHERRRIAGIVHDRIVHNLAGRCFSMEAAARQLPAAAREALTDATAATRESIRELRSLLVDIYPPSLHSAGLDAALADLLVPLQARGIEVRLYRSPGAVPGKEAQAVLFRVAREALDNVLRHADCHTVAVSVTVERDRAVLVVEDDGRGFSQEAVEQAQADGHIGLRLLADLVSDAGGSLRAESKGGQGTRIQAEVQNR
jgi:signal transduction histidine kinase